MVLAGPRDEKGPARAWQTWQQRFAAQMIDAGCKRGPVGGRRCGVDQQAAHAGDAHTPHEQRRGAGIVSSSSAAADRLTPRAPQSSSWARSTCGCGRRTTSARANGRRSASSSRARAWGSPVAARAPPGSAAARSVTARRDRAAHRLRDSAFGQGRKMHAGQRGPGPGGPRRAAVPPRAPGPMRRSRPGEVPTRRLRRPCRADRRRRAACADEGTGEIAAAGRWRRATGRCRVRHGGRVHTARRGAAAISAVVAPTSSVDGSNGNVVTLTMAPPGSVPQSLAVTSAASSSPWRSTSRRSAAARIANRRSPPPSIASSSSPSSTREAGSDLAYRPRPQTIPAQAKPRPQASEIKHLQAELALGMSERHGREPATLDLRQQPCLVRAGEHRRGRTRRMRRLGEHISQIRSTGRPRAGQSEATSIGAQWLTAR